jgi:hypothetical protein
MVDVRITKRASCQKVLEILYRHQNIGARPLFSQAAKLQNDPEKSAKL